MTFNQFSRTIPQRLSATFSPMVDLSFDEVLNRLDASVTLRLLKQAKTAEKAYYGWLDEGRFHGRDIAHWLQAERTDENAVMMTNRTVAAAATRPETTDRL